MAADLAARRHEAPILQPELVELYAETSEIRSCSSGLWTSSAHEERCAPMGHTSSSPASTDVPASPPGSHAVGEGDVARPASLAELQDLVGAPVVVKNSFLEVLTYEHEVIACRRSRSMGSLTVGS